jgi:hypothetical protein
MERFIGYLKEESNPYRSFMIWRLGARSRVRALAVCGYGEQSPRYQPHSPPSHSVGRSPGNGIDNAQCFLETLKQYNME